MYIDRRIIYIILGVLLLTNVVGLLSNTSALLSFILTLPAVLIAITFHEFAHAFAADRLGDDTPRRQGRLNLNPLSHLDPIGSLLLVFAGFGWGKPVQIEPRNFNRNIKMSVAETIVAAAGPVMNIVLAFVFAIIYFTIWKFFPSFMQNNIGTIIMLLVQICITINVGLGIFNLIPLPPLDGSKIINGFLPYNLRSWFLNYYHIFHIIFIVIWITGIAGLIISPIISGVSSGIMNIVAALFGVTVI